MCVIRLLFFGFSFYVIFVARVTHRRVGAPFHPTVQLQAPRAQIDRRSGNANPCIVLLDFDRERVGGFLSFYTISLSPLHRGCSVLAGVHC